MSFWVVFQKIIQLFLIILVGFTANKLHFFDRDLREKVTALVLNITLPGVILSTVWNETDLPSPGRFLIYLALVLLYFVIAYVIGRLSILVIPFPRTMRGLVQFALLFSNVGFMGYPLIQSIFGQKGMFYTTMVNLPFNIFILWVGAVLLLKDKKAMQETGVLALTEEETGDAGMTAFTRKDLKKLILSPCILSSFVAFFFALTRLQVPGVLSEAASTVGQITTPATMMIVGSSLAETRFRDLFNNKWLYILAALRVLAVPLAVFLIFRTLIDDPLFVGVITVLSSTPVATTGQMLTVKYRVNEDVMARIISLTVICCGITVPLIATLVT